MNKKDKKKYKHIKRVFSNFKEDCEYMNFNNEIVKEGFDILGKKKMISLQYQKARIIQEIEDLKTMMKYSAHIREEILLNVETHTTSNFMHSRDIRKALKQAYAELGMKKKAVGSHIEYFFSKSECSYTTMPGRGYVLHHNEPLTYTLIRAKTPNCTEKDEFFNDAVKSQYYAENMEEPRIIFRKDEFSGVYEYLYMTEQTIARLNSLARDGFSVYVATN